MRNKKSFSIIFFIEMFEIGKFEVELLLKNTDQPIAKLTLFQT